MDTRAALIATLVVALRALTEPEDVQVVDEVWKECGCDTLDDWVNTVTFRASGEEYACLRALCSALKSERASRRIAQMQMEKLKRKLEKAR